MTPKQQLPKIKKRFSTIFLSLSILLLTLTTPTHATAPPEVTTAKQKTYDTLDVRPFMDGINHWRKRYGRDRNDPLFDPTQIIHISENILAYQNPDGGWPKNIDLLADIPPDTVWAVQDNRAKRSTFDNHNTFSQIEYLAKVYTLTHLERYRQSAERGLDYIFTEQRPTGGWRGWDVDAITYNDGVTIGAMELLRDIVQGAPHFSWTSQDLRAKAKTSLDRAIDVTLKCQIVVNGVKTAWCQQHDHTTFEAVKARTYELASICPGESTSIVRFLMAIENPSPEIIDAIDHAIAWFQKSKIEGIRLERVTIDPVRFKDHTATQDVVVVQDPKAPPLWTRFYEIETNRPFFCNRDGIKVYALSEVALERRTGYGWYGRWPASLIEKDYPEWKARIHGTKQ